jgi:hypothetical protein
MFARNEFGAKFPGCALKDAVFPSFFGFSGTSHYLLTSMVLIMTQSRPKSGPPLYAFPIGNAGGSRSGIESSSCLWREDPMQNRRKFWFTMFAAVAGMGLVVASVVADELFGVITKADADAKKITVVEKDTDKEIEIKITDDTEYVAGKGAGKVDFEKLEKGIEKAKEKGKKGISAKITYEKGVASKIVVEKRKKKAE